jgi:hypothetical protein
MQYSLARILTYCKRDKTLDTMPAVEIRQRLWNDLAVAAEKRDLLSRRIPSLNTPGILEASRPRTREADRGTGVRAGMHE